MSVLFVTRYALAARDSAPLTKRRGGTVVTVTMTERDGKTYVRVDQLHQSVESRDAHIASGMEPAMREALERLEAFVSALAN